MSGPALSFSGGRAYITWAIQHPQDWEGEKVPRDAQEVRGLRFIVLVNINNYMSRELTYPAGCWQRTMILRICQAAKQEVAGRVLMYSPSRPDVLVSMQLLTFLIMCCLHLFLPGPAGGGHEGLCWLPWTPACICCGRRPGLCTRGAQQPCWQCWGEAACDWRHQGLRAAVGCRMGPSLLPCGAPLCWWWPSLLFSARTWHLCWSACFCLG